MNDFLGAHARVAGGRRRHVQRMSVVELIGNGDVRTTAVGTGREALNRLKEQRFDCMVLDLKLPT
jgi:CheY-like chemotaxis protein